MKLAAILATLCFMLSGGLAGLMIVCHKQAMLLSNDKDDAERALRGIHSLPGANTDQQVQDGTDETERFQKAAPLDFRDAMATASRLHEHMVARKAFPGERTAQSKQFDRLAQDPEAASLARERTTWDAKADRLVQDREAATLAMTRNVKDKDAARLADGAASFLQIEQGREEARLAQRGNGVQSEQAGDAVFGKAQQEVSQAAVMVTNGGGGEAGDEFDVILEEDGDTDFIVVPEQNGLGSDAMHITDMIDAISQTEDDFDNPTSLAALSNSLAMNEN